MRPRVGRTVAAALLALACAGASASSTASAGFCDPAPHPLSARQHDRLFRFAAVVRSELEATDGASALVARSGLDLERFGQRYSHAGISLRSSENGPWSVRQLYFACDERVPRLYDQGVAGFVAGTEDAALGYVSIVLLPPDPAQALAQRALDNASSLALLGAAYSANAYAFSERYQNCNQWVAELLALAWGGLDAAEPDARGAAQRWLQDAGYAPTLFDASSLLLTIARPFVPWVHVDDHPSVDRTARRYRVSMPASIEAFVRAQLAEVKRVEICHADDRIVVHRGWDPVAEGCVAGDGDRVIVLD
jgi:hypothetical protein